MLNVEAGEGVRHPLQIPRHTALLREQRAGAGGRAPNPGHDASVADCTALVATRGTPAEHAAWRAKAAAAGVSRSALLREAMARTQTWTAPARAIEGERICQIVRIGNNLNQLARWVNTHKTAAEAIAVIAHLVLAAGDPAASAQFNL